MLHGLSAAIGYGSLQRLRYRSETTLTNAQVYEQINQAYLAKARENDTPPPRSVGHPHPPPPNLAPLRPTRLNRCHCRGGGL